MSEQAQVLIKGTASAQPPAPGAVKVVIAVDGQRSEEGLDDKFAARMAFFTWPRLIAGGRDPADQLCQKPCAIGKQRLAQTFLQPPDIAHRAGVYFLEGILEEVFGFPEFFV